MTIAKEEKMRKLRDFFVWMLPLFLAAGFTLLAAKMQSYPSAADAPTTKPLCPDTMAPDYRPHK